MCMKILNGNTAGGSFTAATNSMKVCGLHDEQQWEGKNLKPPSEHDYLQRQLQIYILLVENIPLSSVH